MEANLLYSLAGKDDTQIHEPFQSFPFRAGKSRSELSPKGLGSVKLARAATFVSS